MRENFARSLPHVLAYEGGFVDHPKDPGGATNLGITIGTLSSWLGRPASKAEVRALTRESVAPIYKRDYWDKVGGDQLLSGVDHAVFDAAVNSGPARARKWYSAARAGTGDPSQLVRDVCATRRSFVQGLKTFSAFGKGWMKRIAKVEAIGLAWAMAITMPPGQVKDALGREVKPAENAAKRDGAGAGAASAAGAAGAGQIDPATFDASAWLLVAGVAAVLAIIIVILARRALIHRERAKAFAAAAAGMGA